jgi:hypothetical protein
MNYLDACAEVSTELEDGGFDGPVRTALQLALLLGGRAVGDHHLDWDRFGLEVLAAFAPDLTPTPTRAQPASRDSCTPHGPSSSTSPTSRTSARPPETGGCSNTLSVPDC